MKKLIRKSPINMIAGKRNLFSKELARRLVRMFILLGYLPQ
jgi:hypothetical protein